MARKPAGWINPGAGGGNSEPAGDAGNAGGFDRDADAAFDGGDFGGPDSGATGNYATDGAGGVKFNKDGSPRKKRGRAAGSTARKSVHDLKASIDGLTNMLGVFHMGIATVANAPEMMLTEEESRDLATAAVPVLELFEFNPKPEYVAVMGLIIVAGRIYIPRGKIIYGRTRKRERTRPVAVPTVTPFPGPAPVAQPAEAKPAAPAPGFSDFGGPTVVN